MMTAQNFNYMSTQGLPPYIIIASYQRELGNLQSQLFDYNGSKSFEIITDPLDSGSVQNDELISLNKVFEGTYRLQSLSAGWMGHDSIPPSPDTVFRALRWIEMFYLANKKADIHWFQPNVGANAEGDIAYEWWSQDYILIISIEEDGINYLKFGRDKNTLREHGSAADFTSAVELMRWFGANCSKKE